MTTTLDPITVEVLGLALSSAAEEMGETLVRSAYSPSIKECRDCSTAIFDPTGQVLTQAEHIPIHLGSLIGLVAAVTERHSTADLEPGDVFIGNDAYTGGGTHLPDIVLVSPVFFEERLVAWVANCAHHADFVDRAHANIYQEGVRIPPVRLYAGGEERRDVLDLVLLNCQVPHDRINDLRAQVAANAVGVERYQGLCERYGAEVVADAGAALLDYAERRMRVGITAIPDGSYPFEDTFDAYELGDRLEAISVVVEVAGDELKLRFDAGPQLRAGLNMVRTALEATVYYAVKSLVDPDAPANAGLYRPIAIEAPTGSVLSCVWPAAVNERMQAGQRVVDLIHGALAAAIPEVVTAAHNGSTSIVELYGRDPRTDQFYIYVESLGGGFGARASKDGLDGVQVHLTNTSNLPVECLEADFPIIVERYELGTDSGGAGTWRGGMGLHRRLRVSGHEATLCMHSSRRVSAPWGLDGGEPGSRGRVDLDDGVAPLDRGGVTTMPAGAAVSVRTPGAGGYGPPATRARQLVRDDLREGRISAAEAVRSYGLAATEVDPREAPPPPVVAGPAAAREGFTAELWSAAEPLFEAIVAHPFLTGLADGTLPEQSFGYFLIQDGHYLRDYARALSFIAGYAQDPAEASVFLGAAARAVAAEQGMHGELLAQCGITPEQAEATPISPSGELYSRTVLSRAVEGPFEDGVAAVIGCLWIYREVGYVLVERGSPDPRYQRWIDSYSGESYGAAVEVALDVVDRIGRESTPAQRDRLREIFIDTCRLEWMFWDAAWRRESWPIGRA
jgi:N-methylhydantoinase B